MRGRPKGSSGIKLRKWTIEEKLEIIKKHVDEHISYSSLSWINSFMGKKLFRKW